MKKIFKDVAVFDGFTFFKGSFSVEDGIFKEITKSGTEIPQNQEDEVISGSYIAMPGMVNLHTHIPMTLFKGVGEDLPLEKWLNEKIFPLEAKFVSPEMVKIASLWGIAELLRGGVTTFSDMYFYEEEVANAAKEANVKVFIGEGVVNFLSPAKKTAEEAVEYTRFLAQKYREDPLVGVAVAPHSPYLCDEKYLLELKEISDEYSIPFHIHIAETQREVQTYFENHGKNEIERFEELGLLNDRFIAAHAVNLTENELNVMAKRGVTVAHCPSSNMKLGSGIAKVTEMVEKKINVAVATDGSASNNNLNLIQEAELAAKLQKATLRDPTAFKAIDALKAVTSNAGRPLGKTFGTIKEGGNADFVLIKTDSYELFPLYDFAAGLLYSSSFADIDSVYVNGKKVVEKGVIETVDHEILKREFDKLVKSAAEYISKRAPLSFPKF